MRAICLRMRTQRETAELSLTRYWDTAYQKKKIDVVVVYKVDRLTLGILRIFLQSLSVLRPPGVQL
jgi:hypothetical protein